MLLVVTGSVVYLALPRGKLCPHCGGSTNPVVLRRILRVLSPWVQWRWCSRCGWEGPGRRGPELGPLDPPVDHDSGFRWGDPNVEEVPIFYWRPDSPDGGGRARPNDPPGFKWQSRKEPAEPTPPDEPGFHFRPPNQESPSQFQWRQERRIKARRSSDRAYRTQRPWYLSWLVSKHPLGFQWKQRRD